MSTERRSTGPRASPAWAEAPLERCTGWRTSRLASSVPSKRYAKKEKVCPGSGGCRGKPGRCPWYIPSAFFQGQSQGSRGSDLLTEPGCRWAPWGQLEPEGSGVSPMSQPGSRIWYACMSECASVHASWVTPDARALGASPNLEGSWLIMLS